MMHTSTSLIRRTTRLLACTTLLGTLAAQSLVSPSLNRTREGNGSAHFPFFFTTNVAEEYLQLHGGVPGARTITSLALRPDSFSSNMATDMTCTLWFSNAPPGVSHVAPASTFLGNHGSNKSGAMSVRLNYAAQPYQNGEPWPRSFAYPIPVPVSFLSNGNSDLVWHLRVDSRSSTGNGYCDSVQNNNGAFVETAVFGAGCSINSTSFQAQMSTSLRVRWRSGGTMAVTLNAINMSPSQAVLFAIGASHASWQSTPLPFEIPGTRLGSSGPCFVHASLDIPLYGVMASSSGAAQLIFNAPEPTFGVNYYTQAIGLAPGANPWNLVTSNANHIYLSPPDTTMAPVGCVHQPWGRPITVTPHAGFVVELR